jgi:HTH-type transcriptional regulator, sugar sensing transcriptional regulator
MSNLRQLGLSDYEEKIYLALLKIGASEARRISAESKVPPTAVYPNLKSLMEKGLIHSIAGEVAMFEALDPNISLKTLVQKKKNALEEQLKEAQEEIEQVKSNTYYDARKESIKVSKGYEISAEWFVQESKKAKKEILVMGWKFTSQKNKTGVLRALKKASDEKKEVKLITNDPDFKTNFSVNEIIKMGHEVRHYPSNNFSVVIIDGQETKITLKNKAKGERTNIIIEDSDLSTSLRDYFLTVWKKAKKI